MRRGHRRGPGGRWGYGHGSRGMSRRDAAAIATLVAALLVMAVGLAVLILGALYRLGEALLPTREGRRCILVTVVSLAAACALAGWRYVVVVPETFYLQISAYRVSIIDVVALSMLLIVAVSTPWIAAALREVGTFMACFFRSLGEQIKAILAVF